MNSKNSNYEMFCFFEIVKRQARQGHLENPWWPVFVPQRPVPPTTKEKKIQTKKHSHKEH